MKRVQVLAAALAGVMTLALLAIVPLGPAPGFPTGHAPGPRETKQHALSAYGKLTLSFVPNAGQADPRVRYSAQAGGASFWFTQEEAVFAFAKQEKSVALRLQFLGADPDVAISGEGPGSGTVNYLIGNDPAKWHTGLPTYREVVYRDLWSGIDLAFRGREGTLKYEFRLAPGADPGQIRLAYQGANGLSLDNGGNLLIRTPLGLLEDSGPVSYQLIGGTRFPVQSRYALNENGYGFAVGKGFDSRFPLTIDPGLVYSTFLGGTLQDHGSGIAVDTAGNAYVTGLTFSGDFPTQAGAFDTSANGGSDAFVTKLDAAGSALLYSTYLGGSVGDAGVGIAVDAAGSAHVTGGTSSADFPTTAGAFDTSFNGDDAFVTKLDPAGSALLYSTYLGGTLQDRGFAIGVDAAGSAYVTGDTSSADFPTTAAAFDTSANGALDAFVTKLDPAGSALLYSTYLGGRVDDLGHGIAVADTGTAYVTGHTGSADFPTTAAAFDTSANGALDAFVTKLDAAGSALIFSTYLGGSSSDAGSGIAVDGAESAYVTGRTSSANFPTTAGAFDTSANGAFDAFVTKLDPAGSVLIYSTYLGGSSDDAGSGIAVDGASSAYVTGDTSSANFPTTAGAFDTSLNSSDAFMTKLDAAGSGLLYSTYLGGDSAEFGLGIGLDGTGSAYVTGITGSADFPTTAGTFDPSYNDSSDAFVSKLDLVPVLTPAALTVSPAADTNQVGTSHTVTATVQDAGVQPVQSVVVRFKVTGSVTTSDSCVTDVNGQCSFTYTGPELPGADLISAYADTNNNAVQDAGEPAAEATKAWVLPASTPGQASGGGHIKDPGGNLVAFGFSAKSDGGLKGGCTVVDQAADRMIKCLDVTALVITGNQVTVYGNATDNGEATTYVIKAADNADPGKGADTFSIQTGTGYSASGVLAAGNIQVG